MAVLGELANLAEPLVRYRQHHDGVSSRNRRQQNLNRQLCLLNWRKEASLIGPARHEELKELLTEFDGRRAELSVAPSNFDQDDLRLFRRALPLLGSAEARDLSRLVARISRCGRLGRWRSDLLRLNALAGSRVQYSQTCWRGYRRLTEMRLAARSRANDAV
jgi:hypothetical protein